MTVETADRGPIGRARRGLASVLRRRPLRVTDDTPRLTICFDDAPESAFETGLRVVEAHGARASVYVACGLLGRDSPSGRIGSPDHVRAAAAAGHEIGCHTFGHVRCEGEAAARLRSDIARNAAALADLGVQPPRTFAYPFGEVSLGAKRDLEPRFLAMRAVRAGLVRHGSDRNQLPALGLEGDEGEAQAMSWIERAFRDRAWLILFTHDVRPSPSAWGCEPAVLDRVLTAAQARGFRLQTLAAGLA